MPTIHDEEFGTITVRKSARATQVKLRVAPDGTLRASLPLYAPLFLVKRLLKTSRPELRALLQKAQPSTRYHDGQSIGKSHTLIVTPGPTLSAKRQHQRISMSLPAHISLESPEAVRVLREAVVVALRAEAKSYLPRRLGYLAKQHGFQYAKVRFSHASGRWGSCSSQGTISLNIALMKLPFELIDYVLIHELSHTEHMNHSPAFWERVESADPNYASHRATLRGESPSV